MQNFLKYLHTNLNLLRNLHQSRHILRTFAAAGISFALLIWVYSGAHIIQEIHALSQSTITQDTSTEFGYGSTSSTTVSGSGSSGVVQLVGSAGPESTTYRKQLTFDNSAQSEDLTDFPVLVKLTSSNFDFSKTKSDGRDIRFYDSDDSTALSYEIESWDANAEEAYIWVKVPQIDGSSSSDFIYMYYGSDSATDNQSPENVWNSNFSLVQHLQETPSNGSAGHLDSTSNNNDGTPEGFDGNSSSTTDATGKIAGANRFDGSDTYVTHPDNATLDLTNDFTIEAWINAATDGSGGNGGGIIVNKESVYEIARFQNDTIQWAFKNSNPGWAWHNSGTTVSLSTWAHVVVTYSSSSVIKTYVNGTLVDTYNGSGSVTTSSNPFWIGARSCCSQDFDGVIDEVRVSSTTLSDDWIAAVYKSENDSFITYGSEETPLATSGTWTSPTDSNVIDLAYNGGWGDGSTGSSTAFSATVANMTSNATIEFQIRTAATAAGLSGQSWSTIGTANSGTTFTADKDAMDALALDTGTDGRYVQVRANFAQSDGNNPQLDSFSLTYMADDTAPTNAQSVALSSADYTDGNSTPWYKSGSEPTISWSAGTDSESGVEGYCIAVDEVDSYTATDTVDPAATDNNNGDFTQNLLNGIDDGVSVSRQCAYAVTGTSLDLSSVDGLTLTSGKFYQVSVRAVDVAANAFDDAGDSWQDIQVFGYDTTSPTNVDFISMPSDFIATKEATLTWPTSGTNAGSDSESGVAGIQYRIGSGGTWYGSSHTGDADDIVTYSTGSYTFVQNPDFDNISEGNNTIYVRAVDNVGNVSTVPVTGVLKVNTVAPGKPLNLSVTPSDNTTNSYAFTWDAPATFSGTESNITYCYTVNSVPTSTNCSFTSAGQTSLTAGAYATQPSTNTLYLVAKDEAGNINYDTYETVSFTYSGSAPGIPGSVDIADISVKSTESWKLALSWEAPSDTGAGVDSYKVFRGTSATTCSASPGSFSEIGTTAGISYTDTGISQQTYYYCIQACDSANNCGAKSSTVSLYPDGKFTTAAELSSGPSVTAITTQKATITWSTARTSDSKIAYGTSEGDYFDEEPSKSEQTTSHSIALTNLSPGTTYYYKAKWTDEDGNTGTSDEKSFTTDPAPEIIEPSVSNISISSAIVSFTAKNATKAKIYYGPTTSFGGIAEISTSTLETTYTVQLTGLDDDTKYFYKINTFDSEDEEYEGDTNSFTTLPRPEVSDVALQELRQAANPTMLVTWNSNTDISSVVTYYPEGNPGAARDEVDVARISGRHRMILRGLQPNQRYVLVVKGVDRAGNEAQSDPQTFTTATDTRPPVISDLNIEGNVNVQQAQDDNQTVQLIVSWNTDEPSTSQVEYGEGTGTTYSQTTQDDKNLTFNHVVIISGLRPSQVYHLRAVSRDAEGNVGKSIDTVTIAPKRTDSAINLVIKNLTETFGFLEALNR